MLPLRMKKRAQNLIYRLMGLVFLAAFSPNAVAVDTILVRPPSWSAAVQAWKSYRQAQGHEILEVDANRNSVELQSKLAELYTQHRASLRFIVLAGDVDPRTPDSIGTHYRESRALVQFGGDKTIGTDNPYGDFNGDDVPEVSVARIPADSAPQLESYLARVMRYEAQQDYSPWRRNVHVIAGVGGFGAVADSVIEMTTRRFLSDRVPGWSELSMTHASMNSHFCPDPFRFSEVTTDRMNQGGQFWVYIGHGHVKHLDYVRTESNYLPIFTEANLPTIKCKHPPVAVFLACYTGAFDAVEDSLAERLILRDQGPIASIAASRVSGPYGLAMLADGLLDNFYVHRQRTLGEVMLAAKQRLLAPELEDDRSSQSPQIQMISAIASAMSPQDYDLRAERLEHVWQMHLLGDPLLRIAHPRVMPLKIPDKAQPGETLNIQGTSELEGEMLIELAFRRQKVRKELDLIHVDTQTEAGQEAFQARYQAANDRILLSTQSPCAPGPFTVALKIPDDIANGRYCVRIFCDSKSDWQVGYEELSIRKPREN